MSNNTAISDALTAAAVAALVRGRTDGACRLVLDHLLRRQRLMRADHELTPMPIEIRITRGGYRIAAHGLDARVNNLKFDTLRGVDGLCNQFASSNNGA
jgi:hypothetical protein